MEMKLTFQYRIQMAKLDLEMMMIISLICASQDIVICQVTLSNLMAIKTD